MNQPNSNHVRLRCYNITYTHGQPCEFNTYVNTATERLWRFEYNPMLSIVANDLADLSETDYLGIFSWKFTQKTGLNRQQLYELAAPHLGEFEVLNVSRELYPPMPFMDWSEAGHTGIIDMIKKCCAHLGFEYVHAPAQIIYSNQFIATKKVYTHYMAAVVTPLLQLLEGEMWGEVNKDAGYSAGLNKHKLKQLTGLEFYNYIPFILERMIMMYVERHKLSIKQLV